MEVRVLSRVCSFSARPGPVRAFCLPGGSAKEGRGQVPREEVPSAKGEEVPSAREEAAWRQPLRSVDLWSPWTAQRSSGLAFERRRRSLAEPRVGRPGGLPGEFRAESFPTPTRVASLPPHRSDRHPPVPPEATRFGVEESIGAYPRVAPPSPLPRALRGNRVAVEEPKQTPYSLRSRPSTETPASGSSQSTIFDRKSSISPCPPSSHLSSPCR